MLLGGHRERSPSLGRSNWLALTGARLFESPPRSLDMEIYRKEEGHDFYSVWCFYFDLYVCRMVSGDVQRSVGRLLTTRPTQRRGRRWRKIQIVTLKPWKDDSSHILALSFCAGLWAPEPNLTFHSCIRFNNSVQILCSWVVVLPAFSCDPETISTIDDTLSSIRLSTVPHNLNFITWKALEKWNLSISVCIKH